MHDPAAFLAAIAASPDDDLPRLVYADWLDENGDADRAEFIRIQCELERCTPDEDRRQQLKKRQTALLKSHSEVWTTDLRTAGLGELAFAYRRGFPHSATLAAPRFAHVAEPLFRLAPTVRAVHLLHGTGQVQSLLRTPQLGQVAELELSEMCRCGRCPILAELRDLFASPLVANLTRLNVSHDRIDPETVAALVSSPHLRQLRALDLSHNALGLGGVRVLAAARSFTHLHELNLSENGVSASGGQVIARAAWLKGLRVLNLSRNRLTDTSGRALLNAEFGDGLVRLDVRTNDLSREVKQALKAKFGPRVQLK
jgi:uncharacterized protein (TIGR02996 family)